MQNEIRNDIEKNTVNETQEIELGYTRWQRDLYGSISVDELFQKASDWKKTNPAQAD